MTLKSSGDSPPRHRALLLGLALVLLTLAVYGQVGGHRFINYDDPAYVTTNPMVTGGLSPAAARWAFTTFHEANWHPLTWLSHQLDVQLFGLAPRGHHLHSVLLHLANVLLLFLFLIRATGAVGRSAFVAALFAVHPLRVESVAWVAERKDVLATLFGLLTLLAYERSIQHRAAVPYLAALAFFALGLMAKPMLVTLPFLLLLLDLWPFGRWQPGSGQLRPLLVEKLPFFLLTAVSAVVTYLAQATGGAVSSLESLPFLARLGNAVISYARYLGKFLVPTGLSVYYPLYLPQPTWQIVPAGLLLLAVTLLVIRPARHSPALAVGWFWYLGMLVPVIGLVQVGTQALADRYAYLPTVGLALMLAWGVPELLNGRRGQRAITAAGVAGVVVLALLAWRQAGFWRDSRTLFSHAIAVTENNYLAELNLGNALQDERRYAEAIPHYNRSLQLKPAQALAHNNLGISLEETDQLDRALRHYRAALDINPRFVEGYYNLASALARLGRADEALAANAEALRLAPDSAQPFNSRGYVLLKLGRPAEAIPDLEQALRLWPAYPAAHFNLGLALASQRRFREAVDHFAATLAVDPNFPGARHNLERARELAGR